MNNQKKQKQQQGKQEQEEAAPSTYQGKEPKRSPKKEEKKQRKETPKRSPSLARALFGLLPSIALLSATLASLLRLFAGLGVKKPLGKRPEKLIRLYDIEGDPECRRVREALTVLDLDAIILPCPAGGRRYREEADKIGGKAKFPFLVDENTDTKLYGTKKIIPYLFKTYGDSKIPFVLRHPLAGLTSFLASLVRLFRGVRKARYVKEVQIDDPATIELYSYEAAPPCRLVREVLTELEIPYWLHNVGKRSAKRKRFVERSGKMMVPYLVDNNNNEALFESNDIIEYLYETYGGQKKATKGRKWP